MTSTLLTWLAVFGFAVVYDVLAVWWYLAAGRGRATPAAVYSAACSALGLVSIYLVVQSLETIVPAALGHAAGTYLAVTLYPPRPAQPQRGKRDQEEGG